MSRIFGKRRFARLAMWLPLALAGCSSPLVVSHDIGMRCEAQGYRVGTDPYIDCATKLKAEGAGGGGGNIAAAAPAAALPTRQVCDATQPNETPATRYTINGNLAYDKKTDLTWQRCSVGQDWKENTGCIGAPLLLGWDEAVVGPRPGWRLPTPNELLTLASPTCKFPSINEEVFPNMNREIMWYWSATPNGASAVWGVDFRDGKLSSVAKATETGAVRLVRNGK